ncbi:hypothetical protein, partial [Porphyromonas loveana]|uniref:hypothetical protein n=1 Tax=Porphyromonas loveana TaxID=1884669 RepID=UPI0035A08585
MPTDPFQVEIGFSKTKQGNFHPVKEGRREDRDAMLRSPFLFFMRFYIDVVCATMGGSSVICTS